MLQQLSRTTRWVEQLNNNIQQITTIYIMKKFVKIDATTFLMLGGGGGLERYVMRWGALEGLSWYGIHGLHGLSCPVMLHGMARMEYMSGACHVMA